MKKKDCFAFAVNFRVLFNAEKRNALKQIAMDALKNESHMIPFSSYDDYDVENKTWKRGQIALPGDYVEVSEWPKDKQIRYAGTLLIGYGPQSDEIYFNSIGSLLNLIELIDAEQKPKSLWQKIKNIFS